MQTSIPDGQDKTLNAGDLADMTPHTGESLQVSDDGAIPFGRMVAYAGDSEMALIDGAAESLAGVLIRSHNHPPGLELDDNGALKVGSTGSVMRRGVIAVYSEQAVSPGDSVRVRHTTATTNLAGNFRVAAVADETTDISAFARWRNTTGGAGIALLEIDMTNAALADDDLS
jgi:hypothetical protein